MKTRILQRYYRILWAFARQYLKKTKPYIVWVHGSVGKTSCRMIVTQTLQKLLPTTSIYTSPKNFNGELGMSLSIFQIEKYAPSIISLVHIFFKSGWMSFFAKKTNAPRILLLEYGIDHPGEMEFLINIAKPDCAIHTQIDAVHSEQFGNPKNIAKEEFLLLEHARDIVFVNVDDEYLEKYISTISCDIVTYSASGKGKNTTLEIQDEYVSPDEYILRKGNPSNPNELFNEQKIPLSQRGIVTINNQKSFPLAITLLGKYHLAYAGIGVCLADILAYKLGLPAIQFGEEPTEKSSNKREILLDLTLQPWRRSVFNGIHESVIIDSTYNASPRSVKHVLEEVTERRDKTYPRRKLLFILGDMRELGSQEEYEHTSLAKFLQSCDARVFLVGKAMKKYIISFFEKYGDGRLLGIDWFLNYEAVGKHIQNFLLQHNEEKYIIVFKWSQNTIFLEEAIKYVLVNPQDTNLLTRQWDRWMSKKKAFLKTTLA